MTDFNEDFERAIEVAYSNGELRVPCVSNDEARSLRTSFYTFRRNLRKDRHALRATADRLSFYIEGRDLVLSRNGPVASASLHSALENDDD